MTSNKEQLDSTISYAERLCEISEGINHVSTKLSELIENYCKNIEDVTTNLTDIEDIFVEALNFAIIKKLLHLHGNILLSYNTFSEEDDEYYRLDVLNIDQEKSDKDDMFYTSSSMYTATSLDGLLQLQVIDTACMPSAAKDTVSDDSSDIKKTSD